MSDYPYNFDAKIVIYEFGKMNSSVVYVSEAITVPMELPYALEANDAARDVWNSCTAGNRRSFCYRVGTAKMTETRGRRVEKVIDTLMEHAK